MNLFIKELRRRNVLKVAVVYVVTGWLIVQVLDAVVPMLLLPDWVARMILLLLLVGLPIALIFAWAFEITPDGIKREKDVDRTESITHETGRQIDFIIIGLLVVAVGYLVVDKFLLRDNGGSDIAEEGVVSIAVLPFVNMSDDPSNEYFSDGLSEELLNVLSKIENFQVAGRTSSFSFKGKDTDLQTIGEKLHVETILEGSVRKAGNQIRITAQLVNVADGYHLWSETYDRNLDDIFAIQDEIATKVVSALSSTLLNKQSDALVSVATEDLDAYDLYLRGLAQRAIASYGSLSEAVGLFKDALARDPNFHDAKLALARTYFAQVWTGSISFEDGMTKAEALAGQVLADRPDDYTAKGMLLIIEGRRAWRVGDIAAYIGILEPLQDIVEQVPNEPLFRWRLALLLNRQGDAEAAIATLRGSLEIDPLNARTHDSLAVQLTLEDRFEEAEEVLHRALELAPDYPDMYTRMGSLSRRQGRLAEGIDWWIQALEVGPQDHEISSNIARWLYLIGLPEEGDVFRRRAEAIAPSEGFVRSLLPLRAWAAGDDDEALELARRLIDEDIENRHFAWTDTLRLYLYLMADQGRNREAIDYVEARYPGSTTYDQPPVSNKVMEARFILLAPLSSLTEDDAELASRTEAAYAFLDQAGLDWRSDPERLLWHSYFTGDLEAARGAALEHLERPAAWNLDWRLMYTQPALADLVADPAIRARLDEYQREQVRLREEVRNMLAERENGR